MVNFKFLNSRFKEDARSSIVTKNILASFAIKGISVLVSFALVPMTIGYVTSELYGVWLTLSSILTWLCFFDIGFSQGLKNKLTESLAIGDFEKGKSLVSTTYFMMLLILVPVCLLIECIIPLIDWCRLLNVDYKYQEEIIKVMGILIAFASINMVVNVLVSVICAYQKVALSNAINVLGNVLSLLVIYIQTKTCEPSLLALSISLSAMPIIVLVFASIVLYLSKFKKVSPALRYIRLCYAKEIFTLGYKFFIINIQVVVLFQSTNILISNVSSPIDVTNYNIAYRLLNIAMMVYTIIQTPLWPAYTDAYAKGDIKWMKATLLKMKKILFLSIVGCFFIVLISPIIYKLWIGDKVDIPILMTVLVSLYVSVYCWMNLYGTLIVGMGKVKLLSLLVLLGMFLHIPLSLTLSNFFDAYGVLISLILINVFYAIMNMIQVNKILDKTAKGIWLE